jgi:hypothetical protein
MGTRLPQVRHREAGGLGTRLQGLPVREIGVNIKPLNLGMAKGLMDPTTRALLFLSKEAGIRVACLIMELHSRMASGMPTANL